MTSRLQIPHPCISSHPCVPLINMYETQIESSRTQLFGGFTAFWIRLIQSPYSRFKEGRAKTRRCAMTMSGVSCCSSGPVRYFVELGGVLQEPCLLDLGQIPDENLTARLHHLVEDDPVRFAVEHERARMRV